MSEYTFPANRLNHGLMTRGTIKIIHSITFDDRSGETYTLCTADTFLGDISGRLGNLDTLGDPGHWPKWTRVQL